jgi:arginase
MTAESDPTPVYSESGLYETFGPATVSEPVYPDPGGYVEPGTALGLMGAEIASAVAEGRRSERPVLIVGGQCTMLPGVLAGMQKAHGSDIRLGLVWFDAHGDFNTPRTSITGSPGGMAVAVAAGLAMPEWREGAGMTAPLPTDRIVLVGTRNLDPGEKRLIEATDTTIAAAVPGMEGADLNREIDRLAGRCDMLYVHVDSDVLDHRLVPNHPDAESRGLSLSQVSDAIGRVMETGKVSAFGLAAVWAHGEGGETSMGSAVTLLGRVLEIWNRTGFC